MSSQGPCASPHSSQSHLVPACPCLEPVITHLVKRVDMLQDRHQSFNLQALSTKSQEALHAHEAPLTAHVHTSAPLAACMPGVDIGSAKRCCASLWMTIAWRWKGAPDVTSDCCMCICLCAVFASSLLARVKSIALV